MQKVSASIVIPLFLLSLGFIFIGFVGYAMSPEWLTAPQIQEQAHKALAQPKYPPPPAGKLVAQVTTRQVCTLVPSVSSAGLIPKITMSNICTDVPETTQKLDGPSTDETNAWRDSVAAMRNTYEFAVSQEAARISERQRADLKSFVKDMVQISTGILGLIAAAATLVVGALKGSIPKVAKSEDVASSEDQNAEIV